MKASDFYIGQRVTRNTYLATVVFNKINHGVSPYDGWVLVQFDPQYEYGWYAGPKEGLVPSGEDHLRGLRNLLWVPPDGLCVLEDVTEFETDE